MLDGSGAPVADGLTLGRRRRRARVADRRGVLTIVGNTGLRHQVADRPFQVVDSPAHLVNWQRAEHIQPRGTTVDQSSNTDFATRSYPTSAGIGIAVPPVISDDTTDTTRT